MATEPTAREDCYDDCHKVEFKDVIGAKTLEDGGHFGDLLKIARIHINEAKKNSELTEGMAGEVYAKAIEAAMAQASQFGLQRSKMQIDIKLVDSQVEYQKHKIDIEKDQFSLQSHIERSKLSLETKKTHADLLVSAANIVSMETKDKQVIQGIKQSEQEIKQIAASIQKIICECENETATTNSKIAVEKATIIKIKTENEVSVKTSNSKMALESAQIGKISIDADNETHSTNSKISLNNAQIGKMDCDCFNQGKIADAQARLYMQQMMGFRDNARQKLFESQMQGYAMIFEAGEFGEDSATFKPPNMFKGPNLDDTFSRIANHAFCDKDCPDPETPVPEQIEDARDELLEPEGS